MLHKGKKPLNYHSLSDAGLRNAKTHNLRAMVNILEGSKSDGLESKTHFQQKCSMQITDLVSKSAYIL